MQNSFLYNVEVPKPMFDSWQNVVDLLASVADVPAALIMRVSEDSISVFRRSDTENNPYQDGESEPLGQGLYCETVLKTQHQLLIPNATKDPKWDKNPDLKLGMLAYCGVPLNWPNGTPFGTICILDSKTNHFSHHAVSLLASFKVTIEAQLETLYQKYKLNQMVQELSGRVKKRTHDLAQLNYALSQEIDRRKAAEDEMAYVKQHDRGTGFLNRSAYETETEHLIEDSFNHDDMTAVLYLGIANGRQLQKKYGHEMFDKAVIVFRQRLAKFLPYFSITGRPSSIDIAITLRAETRANIEDLVLQVIEVANQDFAVYEQLLQLRFHIGIAYQTNKRRHKGNLIAKAQEAMLSCRDSGHKYAFHSQIMALHNAAHSQLENYLVRAVRNDDITLFFQPKVSPKDGLWTGAEALLRWEHPELGPVSSELLIKMAEDNGLIFELGNFVLRSAIEQASEWYQLNPAFKMAVNVSSVQLKNPQFADQVQHLLQLYKLPSTALELELTETSLIADEFLASSTLNTLHKMGVSLSLDDFGTGYASFNYLKKYPFDSIKIDKSFLSQWKNADEGITIIRSIIHIAKKLHLSVVMEGIENEEQQKLILDEGADFGQGYFYGKPMPKLEFEQHLIDQVSVRH